MAKPFCCGWKAGRHAKMQKSKNHVGAFLSEYTPKCENRKITWVPFHQNTRQNAESAISRVQNELRNHAKMRKMKIHVDASQKAPTRKCDFKIFTWLLLKNPPRQNTKLAFSRVFLYVPLVATTPGSTSSPT